MTIISKDSKRADNQDTGAQVTVTLIQLFQEVKESRWALIRALVRSSSQNLAHAGVKTNVRSHQIHCSQRNSNPHFLFHFSEVHMVGTILVRFKKILNIGRNLKKFRKFHTPLLRNVKPQIVRPSP